jgi:hypothetical protein
MRDFTEVKESISNPKIEGQGITENGPLKLVSQCKTITMVPFTS